MSEKLHQLLDGNWIKLSDIRGVFANEKTISCGRLISDRVEINLGKTTHRIDCGNFRSAAQLRDEIAALANQGATS